MTRRHATLYLAAMEETKNRIIVGILLIGFLIGYYVFLTWTYDAVERFALTYLPGEPDSWASLFAGVTFIAGFLSLNWLTKHID